MSDSFPDEVFFEILLRLPVKAIIRCRCVSKTCCSLISSPHLIATHLNRSLSNPNHPPYLLLHHFDREHEKAHLTLHSFDVPFSSTNFTELHSSHQNIDKLRIVVGSSNALLCLVNNFLGPVRDRYVLWNPSIQKAITLPDPDVEIRSYKFYFTSLSFGYVPKTDDNKLVRLVFRYCDPQDIECGIPLWVQIYTFGTHAWRTVRVHGPPYYMKISISTAFLHGAVHRPAYIEQHNDERRHVIVSFDLADEAFREVGMPESLQKKAYNSDVAVLDGFIALAHSTFVKFVA